VATNLREFSRKLLDLAGFCATQGFIGAMSFDEAGSLTLGASTNFSQN
jgi:hypothetical protein